MRETEKKCRVRDMAEAAEKGVREKFRERGWLNFKRLGDLSNILF